MLWELVAVYEFGPGDTEEIVLYEGDEDTVARVAAELERETALGLAGLPYRGTRAAVPLQSIIVERRKPDGDS